MPGGPRRPGRLRLGYFSGRHSLYRRRIGKSWCQNGVDRYSIPEYWPQERAQLRARLRLQDPLARAFPEPPLSQPSSSVSSGAVVSFASLQRTRQISPCFLVAIRNSGHDVAMCDDVPNVPPSACFLSLHCIFNHHRTSTIFYLFRLQFRFSTHPLHSN